MLTVNIVIPSMKIDFCLFELDVSVDLIREVDDAFLCERKYNNTDYDIENMEFLYEENENNNE